MWKEGCKVPACTLADALEDEGEAQPGRCQALQKCCFLLLCKLPGLAQERHAVMEGHGLGNMLPWALDRPYSVDRGIVTRV